jgi:Tfp pilus assembly protein PilZ
MGETHRVFVRPMDIRRQRGGTMLNSEPQAGKYAITVRLLGLIHNLPKDQQVILLKQLAGQRVTEHLFKLIVEMSEDQQLLLLDQLGSPLETEVPERTLSLEGTEPSMRENPRRPCLINADCRIKGNSFRSYILDISIGGVFIETGERIPVGETILLNFTLPTFSHPVALPGKIAWSGPQGFGVKFEVVPSPEGRAIKDYIDNEG